MKETVTGRDALLELEKCVGFHWSKLVSVTLDGARAMCSEKVGLVGLFKHILKENSMFPSRLFAASSTKKHSAENI